MEPYPAAQQAAGLRDPVSRAHATLPGPQYHAGLPADRYEPPPPGAAGGGGAGGPGDAGAGGASAALYSAYLEPHKLRWIARWLDRQPEPGEMDDGSASRVRGPSGQLGDHVAALGYAESVSSDDVPLPGVTAGVPGLPRGQRWRAGVSVPTGGVAGA